MRLVGGHDGLVLDGGQSAEAGLASAAVVGPFDPGDDRDPQLLAGGPAAPVQDVLLQQREERFHRGVVAGGRRPGPSIRPGRGGAARPGTSGTGIAIPGRSGPRSRRRRPTRAATALSEGVDGEPGLHPVADGVAHDPAGVDVLDRAQVELALAGGVLGDVGQPQLVRRRSAVKSRSTRSSWAGGPGFLPFLPRFLPNTLHQPWSRADPPHRPVTAGLAGVAGLVGQQPVAELRVVAVGVEQRVRPGRPRPARGR